ncbi:MAG: nucleotidyltransferase domain-containing protein [Candidatus Woesearchaeota archaeon]
MLKKSKGYLEIRKRARSLGREVVDVMMFGSFAKGRTDAPDIDVCVVFRDKIDEAVLNQLSMEGVHLSALRVDEFFLKPHALIRSLLFEGVSLINGKTFAENFNLEAFSLYTYQLAGLSESEKVRFVYALKGRNSEGLVSKMGGRFLAPGCFLVPGKKDAEVLDLLRAWRVKFDRQPLLLIS